jgi:hypothetical protein
VDAPTRAWSFCKCVEIGNGSTFESEIRPSERIELVARFPSITETHEFVVPKSMPTTRPGRFGIFHHNRSYHSIKSIYICNTMKTMRAAAESQSRQVALQPLDPSRFSAHSPSPFRDRVSPSGPYS